MGIVSYLLTYTKLRHMLSDWSFGSEAAMARKGKLKYSIYFSYSLTIIEISYENSNFEFYSGKVSTNVYNALRHQNPTWIVDSVVEICSTMTVAQLYKTQILLKTINQYFPLILLPNLFLYLLKSETIDITVT